MQTATNVGGEHTAERAALAGHTWTVHLAAVAVAVAIGLGDGLVVQPIVADVVLCLPLVTDIGAAVVVEIGPMTAATGGVAVSVKGIGQALNVHTEFAQFVGCAVEAEMTVAADYDVLVHRHLYLQLVEYAQNCSYRPEVARAVFAAMKELLEGEARMRWVMKSCSKSCTLAHPAHLSPIVHIPTAARSG